MRSCKEINRKEKNERKHIHIHVLYILHTLMWLPQENFDQTNVATDEGNSRNER